jgi:hypothetical protein
VCVCVCMHARTAVKDGAYGPTFMSAVRLKIETVIFSTLKYGHDTMSGRTNLPLSRNVTMTSSS